MNHAPDEVRILSQVHLSSRGALALIGAVCLTASALSLSTNAYGDLPPVQLVPSVESPVQAPQPDWTPTPQAGLSIVLAPSETVRTMTVEQWRAVHYAFGPEDEYWGARTGYCEGHLDPTTVNGPHLGSWQMNPYFWGPVPSTLDAQARQAAEAFQAYGEWPWDASEGCLEWSR